MSDNKLHEEENSSPAPARNDAFHVENARVVQGVAIGGRSGDMSHFDDQRMVNLESQEQVDDEFSTPQGGALPSDVESAFRRLRETVHFHPIPITSSDSQATITDARSQNIPVPGPPAFPSPYPPHPLSYSFESSTPNLWTPYMYNSDWHFADARQMLQMSSSQAPHTRYDTPFFQPSYDGPSVPAPNVFSQRPWLSSPGSPLYASPSSFPASSGSKHAQLPPEGAYGPASTPLQSNVPLPANVTQDISQSRYPVSDSTPKNLAHFHQERASFYPGSILVPPNFRPMPLPYTSPWINAATGTSASPDFPPHHYLQRVPAPGFPSARPAHAPTQQTPAANAIPSPITGGPHARMADLPHASTGFPYQPREPTPDLSEVRPTQFPKRSASASKSRRQSTMSDAPPASAPRFSPFQSQERGMEYRPSYIPQDPFHRRKVRKGSGREYSFTFSTTSNEQLPHKRSTLSLRHVLSNPFKSAMHSSPLAEPHGSINATSPQAAIHESPSAQNSEIPDPTNPLNRGTWDESLDMSGNVNEGSHMTPLSPQPEPRQRSDSPLSTDHTAAESGIVETRFPYSQPDIENQLPGHDSGNGPKDSNQWRRRTARFFWMIASHRANNDLAFRFVASQSREIGSESSEETIVSDDDNLMESHLDLLAVIAQRWLTASYLSLFLFLPSFYFLRVSRLFMEADLAVPMIEQMAIRTSHQWQNYFEGDNIPKEHEAFRPQWTKLDNTWNQLIDSLLREWQTLNIISALLLAAILTILQIEDASTDYVTRYTAPVFFMCSLFSLLFGCIYIIRFGTMRKTHKAAEWALAAQESTTSTWWNVFVLLSLPATFLTWSIVVYIACIMSYIWRTIPNSSANPMVLSDHTVFKIRIGLTLLLAIGILYTTLVVTTFRKYGSTMDETWAERIEKWRVQEVARRAFNYPWSLDPLDLDASQDQIHAQELDAVDSVPTGVGEVFYSSPTTNFVPPSPPPDEHSDTLHDSEHEPVGSVNTLSYYSPPLDLVSPLRSLHAPPVHEDRQTHQSNLEGRSISHSLGSPKHDTTLEFPYFDSRSTPSATSLSSEPLENDLSLQSNTGFVMRSEMRPVTQAPAEHALDVQPYISGLLADSPSTQTQSTPGVLDSELLQPPGSLFKRDFSPLSHHGSSASEMLVQPALDPVPTVSTVGSVIGGTSDDNTLARYQPHLLDETAAVHLPLTGLKGVRFLREAHVINPIPEDKESLQTTNSETTNAPSNQ